MKRYSLDYTNALEIALAKNGLEFEYLKFNDWSVRQLGNCQAWIIEGCAYDTVTGEIVDIDVLQSYHTAVSYARLDTDEVVRCGKWSTTTSKQQTRFERIYNPYR